MPLFYLVTIQNKSYTDANFSKKNNYFCNAINVKRKIEGCMISFELITVMMVWLVSFFILPSLEDQKKVNLVQRLNFGTINAILVLLLFFILKS